MYTLQLARELLIRYTVFQSYVRYTVFLSYVRYTVFLFVGVYVTWIEETGLNV